MESDPALRTWTWLEGRAKLEGGKIQFSGSAPKNLRKKEGCAYQWVAENAIYAPYFDGLRFYKYPEAQRTPGFSNERAPGTMKTTQKV